jgi:hypothetical protein
MKEEGQTKRKKVRQFLYGTTAHSSHRSWLAQWPSRGDVTQGQSARFASVQILREVQGSIPCFSTYLLPAEAASFVSCFAVLSSWGTALSRNQCAFDQRGEVKGGCTALFLTSLIKRVANDKFHLMQSSLKGLEAPEETQILKTSPGCDTASLTTAERS